MWSEGDGTVSPQSSMSRVVVVFLFLLGGMRLYYCLVSKDLNDYKDECNVERGQDWDVGFRKGERERSEMKWGLGYIISCSSPRPSSRWKDNQPQPWPRPSVWRDGSTHVSPNTQFAGIPTFYFLFLCPVNNDKSRPYPHSLPIPTVYVCPLPIRIRARSRWSRASR